MKFEHRKYIVTITRYGERTTTETKSLIVSETPTEIVEDGYSNRKTAAVDKKYEVRDVPKVESIEQQVYRQEVETLDLIAVINAVNAAKAT